MRPRPSLVNPAAIILAAGASTRLGQPKQLVIFESETLIERTIRIAREAACSPIIVVLGANAEHIQQRCRLAETTVLINAEWPEGLASSIRRGIQCVPGDQPAIVVTCDMPTLTPHHLQALSAAGELTASRYAGRSGVPAFFPHTFFPELLALTGDQGARDLLARAVSLDLPGGELDIDTAEDLARLRAIA